MRYLIFIAIAGLLTACGSQQQDAGSARTALSGPDPFMIVPHRPLQEPQDFSALPDPTPGGANRADIDPRADAVVAMGGRPSRISDGVPVSDQALLAHTARFGRDADIRATLLSEDQRRLGGVFRRGRVQGAKYFARYADMALNAYTELARFRAAGVATPTAPPAP